VIFVDHFVALSCGRRVRPSVCLSVCLSHAGNTSKPTIVGSRSFHRWERTDSHSVETMKPQLNFINDNCSPKARLQ